MRRLTALILALILGSTLLPATTAVAECKAQAIGSKGKASCDDLGAKDRGSPRPKPSAPGSKPNPAPCGWMAPGRPRPCAMPFGGPPSPVTTPVDIEAVAREAALELQVPAPRPVIGPDPARNQWNMIPVGFPIWVWTEALTSVNASTSRAGITISMTATAATTTVSFGDRTTITCTSMSRRPPVLDPPDTPSPDCGHVYQNTGLRTITATASWTVTWAAMGHTGTLALTSSASTTLRVGELTAVLVPDR